ncbi:glycoside hydrolase family 127 protein [Niabella sp. CC-SYL272]|uniref:beta-L-arabinofuranosidase domain-containing protein n=1 Tax=Niabella agricola TaxID=2891571 RepID=UPI001F4299AE|nr:beta-L-arabinofuranosidase domain-containing protein [Niabella agricola]MCF3111254.1 glycoside hydrolase family 127 protein [Niabella agricola]
MRRIFLYWLLSIIFIAGWPARLQAQAAPGEVRSRFTEQAASTTRPEGWILEFLQRQRSGLTGHPEVLSYPFNSCLWAGTIQRDNEQHGDNWWRYEQTAYYTDGLLRLGYLLNDTAMIHKAWQGIRHTLDHPQANGRLGPSMFASQWPIAVFFRVLQAAYNVSRDPAIIAALHRHYLSYQPDEIGDHKRAVVNIEGMLWTFEKTGDSALLSLAEKAWSIGGFELNLQRCLDQDSTILHGVTYMEMAKLPALLYCYTGKKIYLQAAMSAVDKLDRYHLLPDGVPSSNEFLAGKNPITSHETCDISDYTWTLGYLLMITGEARWADKIERAAFNAGPGAVSKDFKTLQYFSSVNQFIATGTSNHNVHAFGTGWMAYWPCHETECCAGNVHRFMPNYAIRMWMKNNGGGPVATLYGPSSFDFTYKDVQGHIRETTQYPFSEKVLFTFTLSKPVQMPFTFRIPGWCRQPVLYINGKRSAEQLKRGSFITLHRRFQNKDKVELILPMTAGLADWTGAGIIINRGPLLFSFPIPEKVTADTAAYPELNGKRSADPRFPALDIRPAGNWAYGLDKAEALRTLKVIKKDTTGYPFDPGNTPVVIRVPAHFIYNWKLLQNRFTTDAPKQGLRNSDSTARLLELVPYGTTRLRLTVFPIIH